MDWRDGLKVNTSKKIITGRPKRKRGGGEKIPQTKQPAFGQQTITN